MPCMTCNGARCLGSDVSQPCPECKGSGQIALRFCPLPVYADGSLMAADRAFERAEKGVWPNGKGWLHETTHTLESIECIRREREIAKAELEQRLKG